MEKGNTLPLLVWGQIDKLECFASFNPASKLQNQTLFGHLDILFFPERNQGLRSMYVQTCRKKKLLQVKSRFV